MRALVLVVVVALSSPAAACPTAPLRRADAKTVPPLVGDALERTVPEPCGGRHGPDYAIWEPDSAIWELMEWAYLQQIPAPAWEGNGELEVQLSREESLRLESADKILTTLKPECRTAIRAGAWPAFGAPLVPLANHSDEVREVVCTLSPPETFDRLTSWVREHTVTGHGIDAGAACAVALLRRDPAAFNSTVEPTLIATPPGNPNRVPRFTLELARRLAPDEREVLLHALQAADRARAEGADQLRTLVCEAKTPAVRRACDPPPTPFLANLRRAIPPRGWALTFLIFIATVGLALRHRDRRR